MGKGQVEGQGQQGHGPTGGVSLTYLLSKGFRTFAFLPQPQNLKQQRSRREQFSRAPVSALPLAPNHLGKSQAIWEDWRGRALVSLVVMAFSKGRGWVGEWKSKEVARLYLSAVKTDH